jgi:hypothetical protein
MTSLMNWLESHCYTFVKCIFLNIATVEQEPLLDMEIENGFHGFHVDFNSTHNYLDFGGIV